MGRNFSDCDCNIIHVDHVENVKRGMLDEDVLMFMADFYKALSDSTRIKIISALAVQELCVCDISALLNMTKSAVSHQLQNLFELKLVKRRKQGKEVVYSLADEHVVQVFEISRQHAEEAMNEEGC